MQTYQIVAGFSDIKSELQIRANINRDLKDLQLWFSFEEGVLYVHDHREHEKCIALALYNESQQVWQITFGGGAYGKQLIRHAVRSFSTGTLIRNFYRLYRLHGYITFR